MAQVKRQPVLATQAGRRAQTRRMGAGHDPEHALPASVSERLLTIARQHQALPTLDDRPADVILGYDEQGLPQ
ncbi:MAG: hypothetical protein IT182_13345 [Acidobacteria bacterium]|nr:hypothetical protein [Acidobacteriota bacterium]